MVVASAVVVKTVVDASVALVAIFLTAEIVALLVAVAVVDARVVVTFAVVVDGDGS